MGPDPFSGQGHFPLDLHRYQQRPDGTGNKVHFSGIEEWTIGEDGLISQSDGNFDNNEYQHQLAHGIDF